MITPFASGPLAHPSGKAVPARPAGARDDFDTLFARVSGAAAPEARDAEDLEIETPDTGGSDEGAASASGEAGDLDEFQASEEEESNPSGLIAPTERATRRDDAGTHDVPGPEAVVGRGMTDANSVAIDEPDGVAMEGESGGAENEMAVMGTGNPGHAAPGGLPHGDVPGNTPLPGQAAGSTADPAERLHAGMSSPARGPRATQVGRTGPADLQTRSQTDAVLEGRPFKEPGDAAAAVIAHVQESGNTQVNATAQGNEGSKGARPASGKTIQQPDALKLLSADIIPIEGLGETSDDAVHDGSGFEIRSPAGTRLPEGVPRMQTEGPASRPASAIVRNVTEQLVAAPRDDGRVTIQLKPHGMGLIEVEMSRDASGRAEISIRVQNPMVLDALRAERGAMQHLLDGHGHQGDLNLDFFQGGKGSPPQRGEDRAGIEPDRGAENMEISDDPDPATRPVNTTNILI